MQRSVQAELPVAAAWMVTERTPAVELAVARTVTWPARKAPGSSRETAETVLSTTRLVTAADVVVLPATSVATARNE
ncbi:hypothetical protein [Georgenia sp. SUBG003]|uniref:hypothetical protein n=1 Tax=Georgenia sp. SUBG003 TaxID=1497974 RepID=UPI003AB21173